MNEPLLQKLTDVIKELESLKPVVQRQVAEHNRGGTVESNNNSLNGIYATTRRIEQHSPSLYTPQVCIALYCIILHFLVCNNVILWSILRRRYGECVLPYSHVLYLCYNFSSFFFFRHLYVALMEHCKSPSKLGDKCHHYPVSKKIGRCINSMYTFWSYLYLWYTYVKGLLSC